MSPVLRTTVIWVPRVCGIVIALFLGLLALDAFRHPTPGAALADFAIHLVPAAVVGAAVAAAWRLPMLGAALFGLMAIGYAVSAATRPDWVMAISGPLVLVALLYAVAAMTRPARNARAAH